MGPDRVGVGGSRWHELEELGTGTERSKDTDMNMLCLGWRTVTTCGGSENGYGRNQSVTPPSANGSDSGCSTPIWFYAGLAAIAFMALSGKK